jgi:hypothetical protein
MADIIKFPRAFSRQNDEPPVKVPDITFLATLTLTGGRDVVCSIGYPQGLVSRRMVAVMLRQAAEQIDHGI